MVLYDDLFNMRRQFYEESKRRWEEERKLKTNVRPQCGSSDSAKKITLQPLQNKHRTE